ncbi:hCG1816251 [Homo sapiens]|nr:hCG1816251 [Homo sapiens]
MGPHCSVPRRPRMGSGKVSMCPQGQVSGPDSHPQGGGAQRAQSPPLGGPAAPAFPVSPASVPGILDLGLALRKRGSSVPQQGRGTLGLRDHISGCGENVNHISRISPPWAQPGHGPLKMFLIAGS